MDLTVKREEVVRLVMESIQRAFEETDMNVDLSTGEETRLFGSGAPLDSLGLVSLVVDIEEAIEEAYDISITLATDKAMSRRTSPFSRVKYLVDFIIEELEETHKGGYK